MYTGTICNRNWFSCNRDILTSPRILLHFFRIILHWNDSSRNIEAMTHCSPPVTVSVFHQVAYNPCSLQDSATTTVMPLTLSMYIMNCSTLWNTVQLNAAASTLLPATIVKKANVSICWWSPPLLWLPRLQVILNTTIWQTTRAISKHGGLPVAQGEPGPLNIKQLTAVDLRFHSRWGISCLSMSCSLGVCWHRQQSPKRPVVSGTSTEQRAVSLWRLDLSEELYCGKCNVNVLVNEVMP